MTDIIEQCAEAGNHTLNCPLSDKERDLFARAVIAKFKELTAEPTLQMVKAGEQSIGDDDPIVSRGVAIDCFTEMNEQMWKDIGI